MQYEKPEITVMASAMSAIQGCGKGNHQPDSIQCGQLPSSSAYEADE
jgi:hypothetical protein